ncbi:hypothetical protein B0H17DRAFT_192843 [Mycena rosella]|uniref:AB hydrolase-1 domain-containing protein n=1 Tax=Mycena rosella TaxID=1033263 RepID=A0AAD7G6C1_MYCRO|nr:hypothetical protein B0H17DRAFT_192843 [Mycena rosella]
MARPYTEHTLKLPDGIEILYTDSGAPQTADYTTLVIIHGTGFNACMCSSSYDVISFIGCSLDGFVRLQEHAHKHNLRIVAWNRRGYHGSTKYTDEELADLKAGRKIFLDRLAVQTAWFLEHFIKHEKTPKATADRAAGGFILLGWSFGNVTALALFADPAVIPKALYETVEPHLRSLVLYDPPFQALGYPHPMPTGVYDPFKDPECTTPEELYENFKQWVASYYKHPDIATGHPSGMSFEKRTDKRTISQWTEEEKTTYCDTISAIGPDLLALSV